MKNLLTNLCVRASICICFVLVGTPSYAVQVEGEISFSTRVDITYFGEPIAEGDLIRVQFGYDTEATRMPVLAQFKHVFDVDYVTFLDGSYDLDYLRLQLNDVTVQLPDPKLSITESSFNFEDCDITGLCFPDIGEEDQFVVSSSLEDFYVKIVGGDSLLGTPESLILPDSVADFSPQFGAFMHPDPTGFSFQARDRRGLNFQVVPEPAVGSLVVLWSLLLLQLSLRGNRRPKFG